MHLKTYSNLLWCPCIQIDTFDPGYMNPKITVDASTTDAQENSQVPRCPSWTC